MERQNTQYDIMKEYEKNHEKYGKATKKDIENIIEKTKNPYNLSEENIIDIINQCALYAIHSPKYENKLDSAIEKNLGKKEGFGYVLLKIKEKMKSPETHERLERLIRNGNALSHGNRLDSKHYTGGVLESPMTEYFEDGGDDKHYTMKSTKRKKEIIGPIER